tara:strand:- start:831 stop:1727 length:897 start_codon:yes stop_codon:yes gene_type:complete
MSVEDREAEFTDIRTTANPVPLKIESKCIYDNERLVDQIKSNIETYGIKTPAFQTSYVHNDGNAILVGSGPSVDTPEIRESIRKQWAMGRPIFAIKGAHDWLIQELSIIPDICVFLDPQDHMIDRIQMAGQWPATHRGTVYMLASQCSPKMFDHLSDQKVVIWHALSNIGEKSFLNGQLMVGGGTTSGLRTFNLAYLMGFKKFHLYGFDSCNKSETDTTKRINIHTGGDHSVKIIKVNCNDKDHWCNPAMAGQANEFQDMIKMFGGDIRIKVYGEGLISSLMEERKKKGIVDWNEGDL